MHRLGALAAHLAPRSSSCRRTALAAASCSGGGGRKSAEGSSRPPRLAIGKLQQETNDLSPVPTTRATFEGPGFHRGAAVLAGAGREGSVEGFLSAVEGAASPGALKPPPLKSFGHHPRVFHQ